MRTRKRLEFVNLTERLAQVEAQPVPRVPLPAVTKPSSVGQLGPRGTRKGSCVTKGRSLRGQG
jgi:hypothetical protein